MSESIKTGAIETLRAQQIETPSWGCGYSGTRLRVFVMDADHTDVRPLLGDLREDVGLDRDPAAAHLRPGYLEKAYAERIGGGQAGWGA